jgi:hypothetical protein
MTISEEVSKAYKKALDWSGGVQRPEEVLADALRDTLAELRKAELHFPRYYGMDHCLECEKLNQDMARHHWTDDQWKQLADKELRGTP